MQLPSFSQAQDLRLEGVDAYSEGLKLTKRSEEPDRRAGVSRRGTATRWGKIANPKGSATHNFQRK